MMHANQFDYDSATEPSLWDYQDEPMFGEFAEYVTLELLSGHDWQNLSSEILTIDLELAGGGYPLALEWVCQRLSEDQYRAWLYDNSTSGYLELRNWD